MTPMNDRPEERGLEPDDPTELTLEELARACSVESDFVVALVREGVLAPAGETPEGWRFAVTHLRVVRAASRLERDLGVNLAGAALALELLQEIEALRVRLRRLGDE